MGLTNDIVQEGSLHTELKSAVLRNGSTPQNKFWLFTIKLDEFLLKQAPQCRDGPQ